MGFKMYKNFPDEDYDISRMEKRYLEEIKPELCKIAIEVYNGAGYQEVADMLGMTWHMLAKYMNMYPELVTAIEDGKEMRISAVEGALYKKAIGYKYTEEKVTYKKDPVSDELIEIGKEVHTKDMAPDTQAAKFYLTNRNSSQWKDKVTVEDDRFNIPVSAIKDLISTDLIKEVMRELDGKEYDDSTGLLDVATEDDNKDDINTIVAEDENGIPLYNIG